MDSQNNSTGPTTGKTEDGHRKIKACDVFQERIINSVDTCSNCFGLSRVEREKPPRAKVTKHPITNQLLELAPQRWARNEQNTNIEYVQSDCVSRSKTIFCECGVRGSHSRERSEIVGRERFRSLLKRAIQTIEQKGVSLSREHAIKRAMKLGCPNETRFPAYTADEAIAQGIEFGVEMSTVQSRSTTAVPAD